MKKLALILVFLAFASGVSAAEQSDTCKAMYQDIEDDIAEANYCFQDSDCDTLELGGKLIKFGCYHFVNQGTDQEAILMKMRMYYEQCEQLINDCASAPKPVCVNSKCVSADEQPYVQGSIQ